MLIYKATELVNFAQGDLLMHRVKFAGTGAAPIAPDLIKWYRALGVDLREVYGQTENSGLATGMRATLRPARANS